MSRELILEHANTCIWSRTTSNKFAAAMYEVAVADDGLVTKELLDEVRTTIADERRAAQKEHSRILQIMKAPALSLQQYEDLVDSLNECEDELEDYADSLRLVQFLKDMLEEFHYTCNDNADTKLYYIKSY